MNYNTNQSIFIQIADRICDRVLSGEYQAEARIPSVRELALEMEVNPNTVMRCRRTKSSTTKGASAILSRLMRKKRYGGCGITNS